MAAVPAAPASKPRVNVLSGEGTARRYPAARLRYSAASSWRRKAPAPTTSPPAARTRSASAPSEVTTVSEAGSGWRATAAATSSSAASRPERRAKRTATREPPPASWARPSKMTVTGSSRPPAGSGKRPDHPRSAPRRERPTARHQPALPAAAIAPPAGGPRAHHVVAVDDPLGHGHTLVASGP